MQLSESNSSADYNHSEGDTHRRSADTGAVFVVLPKRIGKKGKEGERRGEGEGERLESRNLKTP